MSTYIDQRVRVSAFKAEQTLTKDTVPVNVDAVVYWTVWDVEKAALEVQEYQKAIEHITQTGLRDTIGKHELSDLLQERDKIAEDLQQVLDRNTNPWGITCQTVGIKDIAIPQDLAEAMSKEAQAERERRARVILGTAETEIAEKFEQASKKYTDNPVALHLRGMNMLFEGLKEKGSMVIVSAVLYVSKIINIPVFILLLLLSGLVASAIRIADQWERAVVLRMGKYNGLKGPGPFMIIPVIGQCVDLY